MGRSRLARWSSQRTGRWNGVTHHGPVRDFPDVIHSAWFARSCCLLVWPPEARAYVAYCLFSDPSADERLHRGFNSVDGIHPARRRRIGGFRAGSSGVWYVRIFVVAAGRATSRLGTRPSSRRGSRGVAFPRVFFRFKLDLVRMVGCGRACRLASLLVASRAARCAAAALRSLAQPHVVRRVIYRPRAAFGLILSIRKLHASAAHARVSPALCGLLPDRGRIRW